MRVCWPQLPSRGDILASSWSVCVEARSAGLSNRGAIPAAGHSFPIRTSSHIVCSSLPKDTHHSGMSVLRGLVCSWCRQVELVATATFSLHSLLLLHLSRLPTAIYSLFNMGITKVWRPKVCRSTSSRRKLAPTPFYLPKNQWRTDTKKHLARLFKTTSGSWETPAP